jgi:membrane protease subunit HflK
MPSRRVFIFGAVAILLLYLASGFYSVSPGARGVVTTFGDFSGLKAPGLNWHVPWPVQSVEIVPVDRDQSVEIGGGQGGKISMLTSDLNIVDVDMTVNYKVKSDALLEQGELPNAAKYLFNVENPDQLVRAAAESALREVVGANRFEPIISRGRNIVNDRTATILQEILDSYDSGIEVIRVNFGEAFPPETVIPAQRDLVDANSEAERNVNEANAYYNGQVPRAQGEARQRVLAAEAYAAEVIADARGAASRFNDVYQEYIQAPDVTRRRMYLETMEKVLAENNKIVIDDDAGGTLPYLNLNELVRESQRGGRPVTSTNNVGSQ